MHKQSASFRVFSAKRRLILKKRRLILKHFPDGEIYEQKFLCKAKCISPKCILSSDLFLDQTAIDSKTLSRQIYEKREKGFCVLSIKVHLLPELDGFCHFFPSHLPILCGSVKATVENAYSHAISALFWKIANAPILLRNLLFPAAAHFYF